MFKSPHIRECLLQTTYRNLKLRFEDNGIYASTEEADLKMTITCEDACVAPVKRRTLRDSVRQHDNSVGSMSVGC